MSRISDAKLRPQIPTALLIGGGPELLQRCQAAAMDAGIAVKACPVSMATALAEERRPVVIVITQALYALDPDGFEAMAHGVVSTLVRIDVEVTSRELEQLLAAAARETRKQRAWQAAPGRYSMVSADDEPAAPRSERRGLAAAAPSSVGPRRLEAEAVGPPRLERTARTERTERWAAALTPAEVVARRRQAEAEASPRSERWGAPAAAAAPDLGYRRRETPAPQSAQRAPTSSRGSEYHVDLDRLFDERGLPRSDPRAK